VLIGMTSGMALDEMVSGPRRVPVQRDGRCLIELSRQYSRHLGHHNSGGPVLIQVDALQRILGMVE
jgi:hypothetical protein